MSKSKKNAGKKNTVFVALISILICALFTYSVFGSYEKYSSNEHDITTERFSETVSAEKAITLDYFSRLTAQVNNAGQILLLTGTDDESIRDCFAQQFETSQADVGLIYSSDGSISYGDQGLLTLFSKTAEETMLSGKSSTSNIIECGDGVARLGIAAPFKTNDGGAAVVMLLYSQEVLSQLIENQEIGTGGRLCVVDSEGNYIIRDTTREPWIEAGKYSLNADGVVQDKLFVINSAADGTAYYAYAKQVGINDWYAVYTAPKSVIDEKAKEGIDQIYIFGIASLVLVLFLLICALRWFYNRENSLQLFQKKFRIATIQSARAAFEYDRRTDRLSLISECEHISLPKPYVSLEELGNLVHPADRGLYGQAVTELRKDGATSKIVRVSHFAGTDAYKWYNVTATRLTDRGEGKALTIGTVEDIDEREQERLVLYERATTDSLTGLCNRAETERTINERLNNLDENEHSAFALIDLDDFKNINDEYGHDFGDKVLSFFSDKLRATFRFGDVIGRLGGDEFVVYMTLTADTQVVEYRLRELMENLYMCRGEDGIQGPTITCSAGCCMASKNDTFDNLYKRADNALYESKTLGKAQAIIS